MKKIILSSLLMTQFFINNALAAETIKSKVVQVTSRRTLENIQNIQANVQVISRENIQELKPNSIPQILNQLGGLTITGTSLGQFNLGATVGMGGYGEANVNNTLILLNGQRINPIDSGSVPWEMIPIESIERIEITKGSASVQYGNRAVGGAINIVTSEGEKNYNRASASYGSFDTQTLSALMQTRTNDILLTISANDQRTKGYRQNSSADAQGVNARLTKFFGENSIYIDANASHRYAQSPGGVVGFVGEGNQRAAKWNNIGSFFEGENYGINLGGILNLHSKIKLETDILYKTSKLLYEEPRARLAPANNNIYDRWNLNFSPRLKIDLSQFGDLVTGYDLIHAYGNDNKFANAKLIDNSVYVMHRLPLMNSLDLNSGFRRQIEKATANDTPTNNLPTSAKTTQADAWDIGFNYKISQSEKVYVKYNQAFRFPNIDEFWGGYPRTFSGALLIPQKDQTYQIGGDLQIGATKITTSFYHTDTSNQIRYDSYNSKNINDPYDVKRIGTYLSTISELNEKWVFYTNSNLQDVSYADGPNKNKTVPLSPYLTMNARLTYKVDDRLSLGAVVNYVGSQYYAGAHDLYNNKGDPTDQYYQYAPGYAIDNFYKRIPSYTVTDMYINYKMDSWDARIIVKNITNTRYSTYGGMGLPETSPGILTYSPYYYPSDPRSVFASLSYNF
ncbi:TonB-dependent receptor [Candidatus Methylopumilus universalis]|uniref:TonB-dependent receptor n=1 Tax=Candidatus Methylopumilus universalis TaxID=2588536 RepID=UPI003BEF102C